MKTLIATLLLATVGAASATPAPSVNVTGARYTMKATEFAAFRGSYDLDNGKSAAVFASDGRFYLQVDGAPRVELFASGPQTFVSRDRALRVEFDQSPNASVAGMSLHYTVAK